jgi:hypothetical protein
MKFVVALLGLATFSSAVTPIVVNTWPFTNAT